MTLPEGLWKDIFICTRRGADSLRENRRQRDNRTLKSAWSAQPQPAWFGFKLANITPAQQLERWRFNLVTPPVIDCVDLQPKVSERILSPVVCFLSEGMKGMKWEVALSSNLSDESSKHWLLISNRFCCRGGDSVIVTGWNFHNKSRTTCRTLTWLRPKTGVVQQSCFLCCD